MPHIASVKTPQPIRNPTIKSDMGVSHEDFKVKTKISESKFTVYLVEDKFYETQYAMKVFPYKNDKVNNFYLNEKRY